LTKKSIEESVSNAEAEIDTVVIDTAEIDTAEIDTADQMVAMNQYIWDLTMTCGMTSVIRIAIHLMLSLMAAGKEASEMLTDVPMKEISIKAGKRLTEIEMDNWTEMNST